MSRRDTILLTPYKAEPQCGDGRARVTGRGAGSTCQEARDVPAAKGSVCHHVYNHQKRTYKTKPQVNMEAHEPSAMYGIAHQAPVVEDTLLPEGYMSLDQFGGIFHQKLDACYEMVG